MASPDQVTARRRRLARPGTATALAVLVVALMAAAVVLDAFLRNLSIVKLGPEVLVIAVYAVVGVIVARRQPGNPIGWILLAFITLFLFSSDAGWYAVLYYHHGYHLPLAPLGVILLPLWAPALMLFPLVILLFPDGKVARRRWGWVLRLYAVPGLIVIVAFEVPVITAVARHDVHIDSFGDLTNKSHTAAGVGAAEIVGLLVILAIWGSFIVHQVLNWRRASGDRRQQLKWLAAGAATTIVILAASFAIPDTSVSGQVLGLGLAALPVGIGIGILRYRLYDIDRLVSRTLAYAIVTGLLIGLYAGLVLLATSVLSFSSSIAVALSTLIAAALFNPLRRRVQHGVDRRFNRTRYDAERTADDFAGRLKDAVDLDAVCADLGQVVHRSLEPAHVSLWISSRES